MRLTWAQPADLVPAEVATLREQGVPEESLRPVILRWQEAGGSIVPSPSGAAPLPAPPELVMLARELLDELSDLQRPDRHEPDDWDAIEALLPPARPSAGTGATFERVHGAWLGRAAGCLVGKPVEKIPREGIEEIARATGNWPVSGYFTARGLPTEIGDRWPWNRRSAPTSLVENIEGMPEDDDLNFPILALQLLERHGPALQTDDVAEAWLASLPAGRVFTAERAAYRNLLDARPVPETATHLNPFREWIGALIRADVHGWAHPGDPRAAARSAWVDARLSHVRNGLYGAMWAGALCASALVAETAAEVLDAGESVVPPSSRLAAAIALGREVGTDLAGGRLTPPAALDVLHERYGSLHWVHTLNNAALIACSIAAADGSFSRGVSLAVTGGWDTDSAGATVGSVLGAIGGAASIGEEWIDPLRNRIATSLPGPGDLSIRELAERTIALGRRRSA
ncbi:ADP-ribosylglycohydrolase family protein [Microbacterium invictum]|uniref:ADP-ribosylglycohydrolase family protein n=1 Tax=Microbacterium invictum TaxID=515415 RepID=A0ABZ0V882_9MICO|nr:ADP-ribosylglycohydrolase family protein [Microbacterium invictum]WQB69838.1 ADP-ribosylglycohydrolase family protein [Microbacterium invictum]